MKLREWLNQEKGRATSLARLLKVSKARVTQMADRDGVPRAHMRAVYVFTEGAVDYESMLSGTDAATPAATGEVQHG